MDTTVKPKHGVFSNIAFSLGLLWRASKGLIFFVFLGTTLGVIMPFTGILIPRIVVDEIMAQASPLRFLIIMAVMAVVLVVLHFLNGYAQYFIQHKAGSVAQAEYTALLFHKQITMDYANREHPEFLRLIRRGWRSNCNLTPAAAFIHSLSNLSANIGGLVLYGGIIAFIHPLIIVLLVVSVFINSLLQRWHRRFDEARREHVTTIERKRWHISRALGNSTYGKDLRMFSLTGWLLQRAQLHTKEIRESDKKSAKRGLLVSVTDNLMALLRDGGAYAFLTYLLLSGGIGLGEFVMLFGAIGGMAIWMNGIITNGSDLFRGSIEVSDRREMLDFPDASPAGGKFLSCATAPEIHLENVSYTYPEAEKATLKNINLTIKAGERLAIVGVNGAGKTTLIKLISGLYQPQQGKIYCENTPITEYDRESYFGEITAVFQDIHLMPTSIAGNVSLQQEPDREKVRNCLVKAKLWNKVNSLKKGMDTNLVRQVNEDAIEFSGGELQKLALARALYKNAHIMILDEPTAALDPIAENEMYRQYASLTQNKTSIYISHRLASTRFCDRIILIDNNEITETGTHDALMALGGKYAQMYEIQASYYGKDKAVAENV
ncbi:MAG: ABC transporter ATP-binding protein/permease [Defluviitaleaceae bacterium]|nr:ABC transporter ATP-binding protein/permease [Defluviitaleaceae bacterium]MCL2274026.1 ABC transporter ATP-binding protein/permease [Defluviitaleaceae bacterium]MCL2274073.1 ABC transporter ATP-binding protein/permease [Defluviitaleaceae bacterium]